MDIISLDGQIYVQLSFLKKYGVNEQSVMNGMNRNRKNKTRYFEHLTDPNDKRIKWILYESISPQLKTKHELPHEDHLNKNLKQYEQSKIEDFISMQLHSACERGYQAFLKHYNELFFDPELIRSYAITHAVFHQIKQMHCFEIPINKIFRAYRKIDGLIFETDSLKSFYAKLKKFQQYGSEAFVHRSLGKTKNSRKLTDAHLKEIKKYYSDPKQLSYSTIHERVNNWAVLNGYSEVSVGTVKRILSDPYIQNQCKTRRNGKDWERYYFNPFKLREEPKYNGESWQLDGSRLQIPYLENDNRPAFLQLFVIMDVHSRKIVGYSTGKTENHTLVISAIKMAVKNTGYLPFEMVTDNSSCFKHERFKRLEEYISIYGTNFRRCSPDSPREKAHVERFFSTFQTVICKGKDGYIGEGIKSKREEGRPAKEMIRQALNSNNLRPKKELELLVDELIKEYNAKKTNTKRESPDICFLLAKMDRSIVKISESQFALMFWDRVQEYRIRNSMILLSEGSSRNNQFQYIIHEMDWRYRLNGTTALVCYQKEDRSRIKLFDKNEKFLLELSRSHKLESASRATTKSPEKSKADSIEPKPKKDRIRPKRIPSKNQLYKVPASMDKFLIKNKGTDE
ncbi:DDE-type integrase/transposase/recombinase [uncultured Fluviicola sp.]|uniref:DDE-type integrase/transposase/recombinase n=1 Tax=uncultured Fluviicola sp. TaxID=463303 RepID=UPI0025FCF6B0|nr:DDE-type integrase/transposase/recombinase [uncultured Fluviicola sp.]